MLKTEQNNPFYVSFYSFLKTELKWMDLCRLGDQN